MTRRNTPSGKQHECTPISGRPPAAYTKQQTARKPD